jgi:type I restriction enzyme R subunit
LAKEIKKLIDGSSLYADFLNNPMIKAQLSADVVRLLYKNGYPPEWNEEVFEKVIEQVENFKQYQG